jgi:2-polyprenyl-3-methyl-5-hydroxy-6-metoxy-1,4-benzoquinol methylase
MMHTGLFAENPKGSFMDLHVTNQGDTSRRDLENFYLKNCDGKSSLFEIWEDGGARGDSVTPSTYSPMYRSWMCGKLIAELRRTGGALLSIGCGNAAVEAELVRQGFSVLAIDALAEAVASARRKGVDALCADIYQWEPERTWPVVYMDGVLGHLYDPQHGLHPALERVRSWMEPTPGGAAALVSSNDSTKNGDPAEKAPGVDGFYWLSASYLRTQALESGFSESWTEEFRYQRPVSGERVRAVMVAHVTG